MDNLTKLEENRRWNERFLNAFYFLAKEKHLSQEKTAKLIGTNSPLISDYKKGKKRASLDIMQRLGVAFGGRLYMKYLTHDSDYMLIKNVPNEEIVNNQRRELNPDYDVIQKEKEKSKQSINDKNFSTIIDLAASLIKEVEGLRQQLTAEREAIQEERKQLHDEIQNLHQLYTRLRVVSYSDTPTIHLLAAEPKTNKKNE